MTKDEIAKQEIIEKAQGLFEQFGLRKTTMDDIASACGKAKSTIYHYFVSKEQVFQSVLDVEVLNLRKEVKAKVEKASSLKDKMSAYLLTFYSGIVSKINLYRIVVLELDKSAFMLNELNIELRKREIDKFMKFEIDYLKDIHEKAYDSGEFCKIPKEDLEFVAEAEVASLMGVLFYVINTKKIEDKERIERMVNMRVDQVYS